jgi:hypothetical protein
MECRMETGRMVIIHAPAAAGVSKAIFKLNLF